MVPILKDIIITRMCYIAQEKWEEDSKSNRVIVTEDNVADVVSMMTGIPVKQNCTNRK